MDQIKNISQKPYLYKKSAAFCYTGYAKSEQVSTDRSLPGNRQDK